MSKVKTYITRNGNELVFSRHTKKIFTTFEHPEHRTHIVQEPLQGSDKVVWSSFVEDMQGRIFRGAFMKDSGQEALSEAMTKFRLREVA